MNIYANVKVVVMLTEWGFSIEYCVVYSEHVVRWRLHIACKGLAWILQKHYANCILITRDYSQSTLRFSIRYLERNSWYVLLCGRLFKITMPLKALILPLKARFDEVIHPLPLALKRHFLPHFADWQKMKPPAKASILLQKVGPKLQNAQKRLYCSQKVDHG